MGRRNDDLDLRTGFRRSPDGQLAAHQLGALAHAMEAEVPRTPLRRQERRLDTLAIVSDPQSKLLLIIAEFHFDLLRLSMSECISQGLTRYPIDIVAHDRVQVPRRAFHLDMQSDGGGSACCGCELFSESGDRLGKVIALDRRGPQPLHGFPSLGDGLRSLINRAPKDFLGVYRARIE